jgi:hypothetical protein
MLNLNNKKVPTFIKGLNDFTIAVILISIVIAVGIIIFLWNQGLFRSLFFSVEKSTEQTISCSNSEVELSNIGFFQENMTGEIFNLGSTELKDIKIVLQQQNEIEIIELCEGEKAVRCEKSNLKIPPGKIVSFSINPSIRPDTVSVFTNCLNAKDSVDFSFTCLQKTKSCYSNWQCCSGYCRDDPSGYIGNQRGICDSGETCYCCENGECAYNRNCYPDGTVIYVGNLPPFSRFQCRSGSWFGPY